MNVFFNCSSILEGATPRSIWSINLLACKCKCELEECYSGQMSARYCFTEQVHITNSHHFVNIYLCSMPLSVKLFSSVHQFSLCMKPFFSFLGKTCYHDWFCSTTINLKLANIELTLRLHLVLEKYYKKILKKIIFLYLILFWKYQKKNQLIYFKIIYLYL